MVPLGFGRFICIQFELNIVSDEMDCLLQGNDLLESECIARDMLAVYASDCFSGIVAILIIYRLQLLSENIRIDLTVVDDMPRWIILPEHVGLSHYVGFDTICGH